MFYRGAGENSAMAERCMPRRLKFLTTQSRRPMSAMSIILRLCTLLLLSAATLKASGLCLYQQEATAMSARLLLVLDDLHDSNALSAAHNDGIPCHRGLDRSHQSMKVRAIGAS